MTLQARDSLQMFTVTNSLDGAPFAYESVWQRKNLLLVSVPRADATGAAYVEQLRARTGELGTYDAQMVVTSDAVSGIPSPGVVVADRWGEIYFIQATDRADSLPTAGDLIEWLRFVQVQCPECQGETR
jgi:hypothetical protein